MHYQPATTLMEEKFVKLKRPFCNAEKTKPMEAEFATFITVSVLLEMLSTATLQSRGKNNMKNTIQLHKKTRKVEKEEKKMVGIER